MTSYKMLTSLPIRYAHRYLEGERKQNVFIVYVKRQYVTEMEDSSLNKQMFCCCFKGGGVYVFIEINKQIV